MVLWYGVAVEKENRAGRGAADLLLRVFFGLAKWFVGAMFCACARKVIQDWLEGYGRWAGAGCSCQQATLLSYTLSTTRADWPCRPLYRDLSPVATHTPTPHLPSSICQTDRLPGIIWLRLRPARPTRAQSTAVIGS